MNINIRRMASAAVVATVLIGAGGIIVTRVLSAQEREYAPTCNMCPGTSVPNTEIQAYVKPAIANQLTDQQIRQVDIGKANVGVAVVYRGKINNPQANVAKHDPVEPRRAGARGRFPHPREAQDQAGAANSSQVRGDYCPLSC